jgi:hypothetical protein
MQLSRWAVKQLPRPSTILCNSGPLDTATTMLHLIDLAGNILRGIGTVLKVDLMIIMYIYRDVQKKKKTSMEMTSDRRECKKKTCCVDPT